MKVIVDRIEGTVAVCEKEDRSTTTIELDKLPAGVQAGDVVVIEGDTSYIDNAGTADRKQRINELTKDMWE